jgi:hypothetical protein
VIQPTYVSFEQAKLLKENGFDELCNKLYHYNGSDCIKLVNKNSENLGLSAPEQWQVCEWLRVNHGIWIDVGFEPINSTIDTPYNVVWWSMCSMIGLISDNPKSFHGYNSPQEAYSAGIDYVLNKLI